MKKTMLVVVLVCVGCAGTGGCDLEDVRKGVQDVNEQVTDPQSELQQTAKAVGTVAGTVKGVVVLLPAIPGAGLIGGIATLVMAIVAVLQGLAKKKVKKTLKAVVHAVDAQWGDTDADFEPVPLAEKIKIKKTVSRNLQGAEIYPEGKVLIQEAKND